MAGSKGVRRRECAQRHGIPGVPAGDCMTKPPDGEDPACDNPSGRLVRRGDPHRCGFAAP
jgi:hypothetical protein